jgi:hypothetical protein
VKTVISAPIAKRPTALRTALERTAEVPLRKKNARTGTIAPIAKSTNDVAAATVAEPPSSCGSMAISSRASVSRAVAWSAIWRRASARACSASSPLAS